VRLYRVFPYLASAAADQPGGAFFRPMGGKNRADSPTPGTYRCLYASDNPDGSIAEAFGRFDVWDSAVIEADPATPLLPGSRFALATYEISDTVALRSLDDARALLDQGLRPSQVVTRDRTVTQAWAARIQATMHFVGVGWWSYYDPTWQSIALWDIAHLTLIDAPRALSVRDANVRRAATAIVRRLDIRRA
jgi:RES domain